MKQMDKIDFVITWVDGNDKNWLAEKEKYLPKRADVRKARYREWDQLRYWFRSIEKYAPWVNKIHFVTWGHIPEWLNVSHPKLEIVKHEDFIPVKYLPVFNSNAIEIHLHRIPNLSEKFVYFCDDFYLMKKTKPSDFFINEKPVAMSKFVPMARNVRESYYYHLYNDFVVYSSYYSKRVFLKNIFKYLSLCYGWTIIDNIKQLIAKNLYLDNPHICTPYLKSSYEFLWSQLGDLFEETAEAKFRIKNANSPFMVYGYQIITGNFHPKRIKKRVLDTRNPEIIKKEIENGKFKFICLSDNTEGDSEFERQKKIINDAFERKFKERSMFEYE